MSLLPLFANYGKSDASSVLRENVSYFMNHVALLNQLIEHMISITETVYDSEDEDDSTVGSSRTVSTM